MKKRLLSIILAIVTLFTIIIPISTYAYNEDDPYKYEEPYEFYQTHISIQGYPGWCINGSWYYHNWTGKPINPEIKVWQSYGYYVGSKWVTVNKNLVEQEDYGKSFTNNVDIGYCKVYVYGEPSSKYKYFDFEQAAFDSAFEGVSEEECLGSYKGPIFVIRPLGTKLNKVKGQKKAVKVTWKKLAKKMSVKRITGYQIQFSTRKDFKGKNKTVTVKGYKNTAKTVKKLKAKKKYYVRVRTYFQCKDGFKAYSTWSKAKTVKTK